jgi:hypothetical protein
MMKNNAKLHPVAVKLLTNTEMLMNGPQKKPARLAKKEVVYHADPDNFTMRKAVMTKAVQPSFFQ